MVRKLLGRGADSQPTEPQINMTPLIDVVFVLLISFIVIAPLLELDKVELASGGSVSNHVPVHVENAGPVQIYVLRDNTIRWNNQIVTMKHLQALLEEAKNKHPGVRPQLFHDKYAHFGTYQNVKNILENVGYQEVDIVLLPS